MKDFKSHYLETINKLIKSSKNLIYITIKPCDNISLNSLRFQVRKSIRSIGKSLSIPYPMFLSVIELSSDISKGNKYIKDLGFHSHLFLDTSSINDLFNGNEKIENIIKTSFEKNGVKTDIKIVDSIDIYDINGLKSYHLKQCNYLTPDFIDTNVDGYDKRINRIKKYLNNLSSPYKIKRKFYSEQNHSKNSLPQPRLNKS